eukprot:SAG25_NODE_3034_length_1256_cov_1.991357_1_plen_74_part_00
MPPKTGCRCDTEHYQTHVGAFFADDEAKQAFVALQVAPAIGVNEHTRGAWLRFPYSCGMNERRWLLSPTLRRL